MRDAGSASEDNVVRCVAGDANVGDGAWHYVTVTRVRNGTNNLYVDGVSQDTSTSANTAVNPPNAIEIGRREDGDSARYFGGDLDEIHISNIERDHDWITTSFNNQDDPGNIGVAGFYTVGSEDASPLTAVELVSFWGTAYDRAVLVEWRTGYEIDNLGFNIYRDVDDERVKLTPSLVAGSGLLIERGRAVTQAQAYAWWDFQATLATPDLTYWLEDVDFDGTSTWHGPMTPAIGGHLIDVGPPAPGEGVEGENSRSLSGLADARGATRRAFLTGDQPPSVTRRVAPDGSETPLETQWAIAQQTAVKIGVRRTGWFRVTQTELVGGGLDPTVDPRRLQLFVNGVEQAMTVSGEADGRFDPTDAVGFYGQGVDTAHTDIRVYWVVAGAGLGRRIRSTNSALPTQSTPTPTPTAPPVTQTPLSAPTPTAPATPPPTAPVTPPPPTATPTPAAPATPARAAPPTVTATSLPTPPATPAPAPAATTRAIPQRPQRRRPTPEPAAVPVTIPGDPEPVAPVAESTPALAPMPVFPTGDDVARARAAARTAPSRAERPDRNAALERQLEAARRLDAAVARARAAGVPKQRIQAIAADGRQRRNKAVVDELRRERLTALGYDLGMSPSERQRLRALAARAAAGALTEADIHQLRDLVAADPSYFDELPRRGAMTPEASDSGDLAGDFEPGLDAAWAQMPQRAFEAATASPESTDGGPEGETR